MKPVKREARSTYDIEWYATPLEANVRGDRATGEPGAVAINHTGIVEVGRAPELDRHDHDTGAQIYAVVVP